MNRRQFILGGAAIAVAGVLLKPNDVGAPYSSYFNALNQSLRDDGPYLPSMLVDLDIIDQNIDTLRSELNPATDLRIVAKSLPSPELLGYIMDKAKTNKLMVFHQPFLSHIATAYPDADVLMGKPMPVKAAQQYYLTQDKEADFDSAKQLQWLIDSPARLHQYLELAKAENLQLQINIELDVGLHRGGLQQPEQLDALLTLIKDNPLHLSFSGFMGYDPHVVKLPAIIKSAQDAYQDSQQTYQAFVDRLYQFDNAYQQQALCFNGAGSPTIALHKQQTVANELSAGSCLVKPSDFDIPSLAKFTCAAYIATPVLKKMNGTQLPATEFAKDMIGLWDPNRQQTYFIYGGKWLANFESPKGLHNNSLFGSSTNQQIVNGSQQVNIDVDDHVFLRPSQSEFVFLQFGNLLSVRNKKIDQQWSILKQG